MAFTHVMHAVAVFVSVDLNFSMNWQMSLKLQVLNLKKMSWKLKNDPFWFKKSNFGTALRAEIPIFCPRWAGFQFFCLLRADFQNFRQGWPDFQILLPAVDRYSKFFASGELFFFNLPATRSGL